METKDAPKLAVLISGSGTLLDAIVEAGIKVAVVVADRPCLGLEKAEKYGIPTELIERTDFTKNFDRDAYTKKVVETLKKHDIGLVSMAGWLTVLGPEMFEAYESRVTNNHPSLLPAFIGTYGTNTVREAMEYGVKITGCTIHIATAEVDHGPILAQEAVEILPKDTVETLQERIKVAERKLLPQVLKQLLAA